MSWKPNLPDG